MAWEKLVSGIFHEFSGSGAEAPYCCVYCRSLTAPPYSVPLKAAWSLSNRVRPVEYTPMELSLAKGYEKEE